MDAKELHQFRQRQRDLLQLSDRYVLGGVRWEVHSHRRMHDMLHEQADPSGVHNVAATWRRHGMAVVEQADELMTAIAILRRSWEGTAAAQAAHTLAQHVEWLAQIGRTAVGIGDAIADSATALTSAQNSMPEPVDEGHAELFSAPLNNGLSYGHQVGYMGSMAVISGHDVVAQANDRWELKRIAMEVMEVFERTSQNIDEATPRFPETAPEKPGDAGSEGPPPPPPPLPPPPPPPPPPPWPPSREPGVPGHDDLSVTVASASITSPDARWQALTGSVGSGHHPVAAPEQGAVSRTGLTPPIGVVGHARTTALPTSRVVERTTPGLFGSPAAANREEDKEHRRRIPYEEDHFACDTRVAPPVIGLLRPGIDDDPTD